MSRALAALLLAFSLNAQAQHQQLPLSAFQVLLSGNPQAVVRNN